MDRRTVGRHGRSVIVAALLSFAPWAAATAAQETAAQDTIMSSYLVQLGEINGRIGFLAARFDSAAGEDRELFADQLSRRWEEHHRLLGRMVEATEEARESGTERADATALVRSALLNDVAWFRTRIDEVRGEIQQLRLARPDTPPDRLTELEIELTERNVVLDRLIVRAVDDVEWARPLGVDLGFEHALLDRALENRAAILAARIELAADQKAALLERAGRPAADSVDIRARVRALDEKLFGATNSLQSMVALMQRRNIPTADHQKLLLETTGDLGSSVLDPDVVGGLLADRWGESREWLAANSGKLVVRTLTIVLVLVVFGVLARLGRRGVKAVLGAARVDVSELLKRLLIGLTSKMIWFVGFLVVLSMLGVDVGPALAGLGIAGFVIGFALQDTLSNFASGLMIMFYQPFDVGDFITAGGVSGAVQSLTLVSTMINTPDNQLMIIPNNKVWGDVINNVTAEDTRRVDLVFGISYQDDIEKARGIMREVVSGHELVLDDPAPVIRVNNLGDSSVDFVCRPWCRTEDFWTVRWDIMETVKNRFDAEGVSIPFPQRDVHLYSQTGGAAPEGT